MAKPFGKIPKDWTRLKSTTEFINALSTARQIILPSNFLKVTNGDNGGKITQQKNQLVISRKGTVKWRILTNGSLQNFDFTLHKFMEGKVWKASGKR